MERMGSPGSRSGLAAPLLGAVVCLALLSRGAAAVVRGPDQESSLVTLQSGGYKMNVTVVPGGTYHEPEASLPQEEQVVVSSWAMVALSGDYPGSIERRQFPWLAQGLRDAVADSLGVCRSAVSVVDMRAVNYNFVIEPVRHARPGAQTQHRSLVHRFQQLMRSSRDEEEDVFRRRVNITRVRATYEVRIFGEMRVSAPEVARRVDRLQMYNKFSELSRQLTHALAQHGGARLAENILLDDVGYATRRVAPRAAMTRGALSDCVEEALLHDARAAHQYFVAASLFLVALITCIGSSVFTIKHPSLVPSRMNPLMGPIPG